jgi:hypothetical protein
MAPHCSISTPPHIEDGKVVMFVVYEPSGQVFRCELTSFDDVVVEPVPHDSTPSPEGDARGEVAEAAIQHARDNQDEFIHMFAEL